MDDVVQSSHAVANLRIATLTWDAAHDLVGRRVRELCDSHEELRRLLGNLVEAQAEIEKAIEEHPIKTLDEATPQGIAGAIQINAASIRLRAAWEEVRAACRTHAGR